MNRGLAEDLEAADVCRRWALRGPPGTLIPCASKYLGSTVEGPPSVGRVKVLGCAIPPRHPGRLRRGATRACEGAYVVQAERELAGVESIVPKSRLRDWARAASRGGPCSDWLRELSPSDLAGVELRARNWGVTPFETLGELPTPHRKGSSICCRSAPTTFEALRELQRDAFEGTDDDARRFVERLRGAIPRGLRGELVVADADDGERVLRALSDHCMAIVERWASKRRGKALESSARTAARKRAAALRAGEDVTDAGYRDELETSIRRAARRRPKAARFSVGA